MDSKPDTQPRSYPAKIKAVLFDLGDTILNFGKVKPGRIFAAGAKASYAYLRDLGLPVGGFKWYFWRNLIGLRTHRLISAITRRDFDVLALLKEASRSRGISLDPEQAEQLVWLWYEPLSKIGWIEPETEETLTTLKDHGLKLGLLSNTFVNASSLERHLEQLGILDFFTVRLYSYQFPFRKPDLRIFKAAVEKMGEPAENILYVGDRIDKDIKPAIKTGMTAVLKDAYTNAGRTTPNGARRIQKISDLPTLIKNINTLAVIASAARQSQRNA